MEYIRNDKPAEGCVLCLGSNTGGDSERLVLHRTSLSFVMLNRFPYSNGHLMVSPLRHLSRLEDLTDEELCDLTRTIRLASRVLTTASSPQGINLGANFGKAAGAGIDDHLHIHLVPRWNGDTNFMTVIGDIRVMPENLSATYGILSQAFDDCVGG
jgi:ATP adenylyltransferase